jgi:hypothetical protein
MTFKSSGMAVVLGTTALLAACATMSVGSYVARGVDVTRYRTFAWAAADALPIGDPRLDNNAIFKDYLQGAVERHLRGRGVLLVAASAQPDLLVHFHGSVTQRVDAMVDHTRGDTDHALSVVDFEEGTLVLDVVEVKSDRLVFRGWAVDSLSGIIASQDRMEQKIEEAVTKMLASFGPS